MMSSASTRLFDKNSCWICGVDISSMRSREHRFKRSDVKDVMPNTTQKTPGYLHLSWGGETFKKNIPIRSIDSDYLKFDEGICTRCNNQTTQEHDKGWSTLSSYLRDDKFRAQRSSKIGLYRFKPPCKMKHVQLYFCKKMGCSIKEMFIKKNLNNLPKSDIDDLISITNELSTSIINGELNKNFYIKFDIIKNYKTKLSTSGLGTIKSKTFTIYGNLETIDKVLIHSFYLKDGKIPENFRPLFNPNSHSEYLSILDQSETDKKLIPKYILTTIGESPIPAFRS